jgi:hypothetical protein
MSEEKSDGKWKRGQSGNPAGRKPEDKNHVRNLAREHTEKSINTLVGILETSKNDMARLRSAEALLARGWGQPVAHIETTSSLAEEIDKIKRRSVAGGGSAEPTAAAVVPLFPASSACDENAE